MNWKKEPWTNDVRISIEEDGCRTVGLELQDFVCSRVNACIGADTPRPAELIMLRAGNKELVEALDEVRNYEGGADNVLEDKYVMGRVDAAIANARSRS